MRCPFSRWVVWLAVGFAIAAVMGGPPAAGQSREQWQVVQPPTEEFTARLAVGQGPGDKIQVMVVLKEPGAGEVFSQAKAAGKGSPEAFAAAQSQFFAIEAAQQRVAAALAAQPIAATEIFRVKRAANAISVYTTRAELAAIRALPGVKAVHIVEPEYLTNSTSVPFIGAHQVWTDTLGLGKNLTGQGIRIGIIDTGIDYIHANFGGDGQSATYTTAATATSNFTTLGGGFPSAKVVGGWDFAGDAYTGNNSPAPDPNPMDCGGHGSHVAGTAAGYGVTSSNTTFAGPYNTSVPFGSLKIGPGVAPLASLYSLRVFGCGGSTGLTVEAIDWAMDPNGDGDMSDHLDVINMSLGSPFGRLSDDSAMASDMAAAIGVVVVCSAGNAGDTFFIAGSPGNGQRVISTAAIVDSGNPGAVLTVTAPAGIAGNYAAAPAAFTNPTPAPNPSGQTGPVIYPASNQNGCAAYPAGTFTNSIALIDRGTCSFDIKVINAQNAGAIGAIMVNNVPGDANLVTMGSSGPNQVNIPSVFISMADGAAIKANLPVTAILAAADPGDSLASFSSRGPLPNLPVFLKPDVSAPGLNITSTLTGWTCDGVTITGCIWPTGVSGNRINPNSQAGVLSGTSMASPHMAGTMALLKQLHPDWSVEELKALAMNTALHNVYIGSNHSGYRYGPDRIGTGREDVPLAAQNNTAAFNGADPGTVSVSFGTEVVGSLTATRTVKVANKGTTNQTYTLGIETVEDNPGVSYSFPGGTNLVVPAGKTVTFMVQISATADNIKHTIDPTVAPNQSSAFGTTSRHWLTEEAGYITFSQGGVLKMRVPVFSAPVPASTMSGGPINTGGANPTNIALSGSGVCTGTHTIGPPETCGAPFTFPNDELSLVSPFELQVAHPATTDIPAYMNLQYAGVAYDSGDNIMMFGVSTWGDWATPSDVSFAIYIDCGVYNSGTGACNNPSAPDGIWDFVIVSSDFGSLSNYWFAYSYNPNDSFVTGYLNLHSFSGGASYYTNLLTAAQADTRLFNNNVLFIPVLPRRMGFGTTNGVTPRAFKYKIETCPGWAPGCGALFGFNVDSAGATTPFHFDPTAQGLNFGNDWLSNDLNGSTLPVTFNTANLAANGSLGGLLLHHHNAAGTRAQVVLLDTAASADLSLTASVTPFNPPVNANVTYALMAHNNGPSAATGVVVAPSIYGPQPLDYVSDDGGGAFDHNTGLWTIGNLTNGGSATLHVTLKVLASGPIILPFTISNTSPPPLDPNPANNTATTIVNAVLTADLSVTKIANPPNPAQGQPVTFTVTASNAGPDTAFNVVVNDLLNSGFVYQSYTATAGVYNPGTGAWTIASIPIGTSETLTINAIVAQTGTLSNTATVASDASDPNLANNSFTLTFTTTPPIPLLSLWGLLLVGVILALAGIFLLRRLG